MADGSPDEDADLARPSVSFQADEAGTTPFSSQASLELRTRIARYADDLIEESVRVAKRRGSSDVVSVADVERASEHLGLRPRSRRARVFGSIGSILFGAALGNALQIVGAQQIS